jgi:sugar lactone lactonase YvrE
MADDKSVTCVADVQAVLGEGPIWVERDQSIYWVDIKGRRLFRSTLAGELSEWQTPLRVCSLAPRAAGGFVAGTEHGFAWVDPGEGRYEIFADPEPERPSNRFNDGKLDRAGRFWAGTMDDSEQASTGALYRLVAGKDPARIDDGYRVTNGPAFSPEGDTMYHTDSARQCIYAFALDAEGAVSGKRVFARFGEGEGYPDGMTVDSQGCLWVAFWDGWCLRRLSPAGERISEVELPVQRPTSCAFGGPNHARLFVTSARIGLDPAALENQPQAGGLFALDPGVAGLADTPFPG